MELRHLRVLIPVADELRLGRAAERLNPTAHAVSGQIASSRPNSTVRLLHRSARYVALAEAGRDADRIVKQADAAFSSVRG